MRLDLSGAEAASGKICAAEEAKELKAACEASRAVCTSLVREKKSAAPPKPFDLTSLQREANRIFGYTAKQTLDLAQALYEKKLLVDLANAVKADKERGKAKPEKKPSIRAQLLADKEKAQKKPAKQKSQDLERS